MSYRFFKPAERRLKIMRASPELIASTLPFGHGKPVRIAGIPEGCRVVAVWWDDWRRAFCFAMHHESFAEVPDCDALPELEVTITEATVENSRVFGLPEEPDNPLYGTAQ